MTDATRPLADRCPDPREPGPARPVPAQSLSGLRVDRGGVDLLANPAVGKDLGLDGAQSGEGQGPDRPRSGGGSDQPHRHVLEGLEGTSGRGRPGSWARPWSKGETKALSRPAEGRPARPVPPDRAPGARGLGDGRPQGPQGAGPRRTSRRPGSASSSTSRVLQRREAQSNTRGDRRASLAKIQALRKEARRRRGRRAGPGAGASRGGG